jgi:hypothetical protein
MANGASRTAAIVLATFVGGDISAGFLFSFSEVD